MEEETLVYNNILHTFFMFVTCLVMLFAFSIYVNNLQYQHKVINAKLARLDMLDQQQLNLKNKTSHDNIDSNIKNNSYNVNIDSQIAQGIPINIKTRGGDDIEFKQVGVLSSINNDDTKNSSRILPLFGKPTFTRSSKWNYYTSTDGYHLIRLSVNYKNKDCMNEYGCDEIYDEDEIYIDEYNQKFKVKLYQNTAPKYIPFVV